MLNKKADMSMGFIIVAAIGILLLVIITALIIRSSGGVVKATGCQAPSICVPAGDCNTDNYQFQDASFVVSKGTAGCKNDEICCTPMMS